MCLKLKGLLEVLERFYHHIDKEGRYVSIIYVCKDQITFYVQVIPGVSLM